MDSDIRFILESATRAPTGENDQPWKWTVLNKAIELRVDKKRMYTPYSIDLRITDMSLGGAIENLAIAASARGYQATVTYFPDSNDQLHIADIILEKGGKPDELYREIEERQSNREPYRTDPLTHAEIAAMVAANPEKKADVLFITDRNAINKLARATSVHERFIFGNKTIHDYFFSHVNWTKRSDEQRRIGLSYKLLGLPAYMGIPLWFSKTWPIGLLKSLGFPVIAELIGAMIGRKAGAYGAIVIESNTLLDFVKAGRVMERVWLTATGLGLAVQPMTGIVDFMLEMNKGFADQIFSLAEKKRIKKAYETIETIYSAKDKTIAFLFRIGRPNKRIPSKSLRLPIEKVSGPNSP